MLSFLDKSTLLIMSIIAADAAASKLITKFITDRKGTPPKNGNKMSEDAEAAVKAITDAKTINAM